VFAIDNANVIGATLVSVHAVLFVARNSNKFVVENAEKNTRYVLNVDAARDLNVFARV